MLFFNFLCLLYLMVLANGFTISKSIAIEDDAEYVFDSLNDVDQTKDSRLRHDRFRNKYRRGNTDDTTTPLQHTRTNPPNIKKSKTSPITREKVKKTGTNKLIVTITTPRDPNAGSNPTTNRLGILKFWKKLKYNKKHNALNCSQVDKQTNLQTKGDITLYNAIRDVQRLNKRRRKNNKQFYLDKERQSYSQRRDNDTKKEMEENEEIAIKPYRHYMKNTKYYKPGHTMTPDFVDFKDVSRKLDTMTTKLTHLKRLYGIDRYKPKEYTMPSEFNAIQEGDFPGTAQIEVLLNDIKKKAVQMLAEQSHVITDLVTNTATEATFEADPILSHSTTYPNYALTTFFNMKTAVNYIKKRTPSTSLFTDKLNDTLFMGYINPKKIRTRSIGAEAMTIAQSVEDMLQKELKCAYKKFKHRVTTDFKHELTTVKSTIKNQKKKIMAKFTPKPVCDIKTSPTTTPSFSMSNFSNTPVPMLNMKTMKTLKHKKTMKVTKKAKTTTYTPYYTYTIPTSSTYDDFALLTLYEQMLTKPHNNVILMPMNAMFPSRRKRRENLRNPETLTDLSLKEHIQKIYQDGEEMPEEVDYAEQPPDATSSNDDKVEEKVPNDDKADDPMTDTSFQGLSSKISYNDYVNGYKHYLKFQKELGEPQWSNQIKYQAHKHHSVDDIGKFILNKLPHVPATKKYKRHFFDDTDTIDDQDVSTKSDDSWFKKHFYMFIETGPPKKFHNTQTVSLKSPVTESETGGISVSARGRLVRNGISEEMDSHEINLDELSKSLYEKSTSHAKPVTTPAQDFSTVCIQLRNVKEKTNEKKIAKKDLTLHNILGKIFGSNANGKTTKRATTKLHTSSKNIKEYMNDDYLVARDSMRLKRDETNDYKSTEAPSSPLTSHKKANSKKIGYVNVDLVPRVTEPHVKNKQKGKLRRFFSKLRLRNKHKHTTSNKVKRDMSPRIERFNPFKKLKDIFGGASEHNLHTAESAPDYDMFTTEVFKQAKLGKSPSIDDMKSQVPNITYDIANDLPPLLEKGSAKTTTRNNMMAESTEATDMYPSDSSDTNTESIISTEELKTTTKRYDKVQFATRKYPSSKALSDQNYKSTNTTSSDDTYTTTTSPVTLDQLRNDVDDLKFTLSTLDYSVTTPANMLRTVKGKKIAIKAKKPLSPEAYNIISKNFFTYPKSDGNTFFTGYTNTIQITPYTSLKHLSPHKREKPSKLSESKTTSALNTSDKSNNDVTETPRAEEPSSAVVDKVLKVVPDYFNDLLLWHKDILETENVGNPTWEAIQKDLNDETGMSTPDVQELQKEIAIMKNYLQSHDETPKEKHSKLTNIQALAELANQILRANDTSKENMLAVVSDKNKNFEKDNYIEYTLRKKYPERSLKSSNVKNLTAGGVNMEPTKQSFMNKGFVWKNENDDAGISSNAGAASIFVDTTILSYDDAVNYVTAGLDAKKLSKNSLQSTTSLTAPPEKIPTIRKLQFKPQPIAKTNKQPVQYFTTPLPMKVHDFERFLKDNNLDVESVTSPLIELPSFVDLWGGKLGHRDTGAKAAGFNHGDLNKLDNDTKEAYTGKFAKVAITKNNPALPVIVKVKTNSPETFSEMETENQMEYLEKLRIDLTKDYNFDDDDSDLRVKRYDFYYDNKDIYDPNKRETLARCNYYDKFKKKFFEKKATPKSSSEHMDFRDILTPSNDKLHREMEITIINLDDINNKFENDKGISSEVQYHTSVKDEEIKTSNTKTTIVTPTKTTPIKSNIAVTAKETQQYQPKDNVSYEKMFKELNSMINSTDKSKKVTKNNTIWNTYQTYYDPIPDDRSSIATSTTAQPPDVKPKRIQISSHCYKYDIFYNEPPRSKISQDRNSWTSPRTLTKAARISSKHNFNANEVFRHEESGFYTKAKKFDINRRWTKNARLAREVNTANNDDDNNDNTMETNVDDGETSTTTEAMHKLLKKLNFFTRMHDKFRFFAKDISTSTEAQDRASQPAGKGYSPSELSTAYLKDIWCLDENTESLTTTKGTEKSSMVKDLQKETISTLPATIATKVTKTLSAKVKKKSSKNAHVTAKPISTTVLKTSKSTVTEPKTVATTVATTKDTTTTASTATAKTTKMFKTHTSKMKAGSETTASNTITECKPKKVTVTDKPTTTKVETMETTDPNMRLLSASQLEAQGIHMVPKSMTEGETFYVEPGAYDEVKPTVKQDQVAVTELKTKGSHLVPKPTKPEMFYVEPGAYDEMDKVYYETEALKKNSKIHTIVTTPYVEESSDIKIDKRDVQPCSSFTAKDVAALEVIVDLMRNTQAYDDAAMTRLIKHNENMEDEATNAIQVHIAIPFDLQDNKKRSLEAVRVRKVFSAKMSSPVDLEYQVHSYDNIAETTTSTTTPTARFDELLSPGLYLLINDGMSLPKGQFALKPVHSTVSLSNLNLREVTVPLQKYEVIDTNVTNKPTKLSKEFLTAVNKHLVQLYENLTAINETHGQAKENKRFSKRSLDVIKKYFGHDRVCACKCRPNRTICRACAASDSVISELIFEFENLANYMRDHCTEIQTFFWMNPSGGKKLTEAVHKIDRNLKDYYKTVKKKCHGRTCNSFATAIDKRAFNNDKVKKNYIGTPMANDLMDVANVLRLAKKVNCYNETLKEKSHKLVDSFNACIATKNVGKRSTFTDLSSSGRLCKNVYSLDNINVNIICHPESTTDMIYSDTRHRTKSDKHIFDYVIDGLKRKKKGKSFKTLFAKKDNLDDDKWLTYYNIDETIITTDKPIVKRQADGYQIESPLIADTGGSFWFNYIKGKRKSTVKGGAKSSTSKSHCTTKLETTSNNTTETTMKNKKQSDLQTTTETLETSLSTESSTSDMAVGEDSLSENINELLKLFGSLADLEEMKAAKYDTATELTPAKTKETGKSTKAHKSTKPHKQTKGVFTHNTRKKIKAKHKPVKNVTGVPTINYTVQPSTSTKSRSTLPQSTKSKITGRSITQISEQTKQTSVDLTKSTDNITERPNIFDKIKKGTISMLKKFQKNYVATTTERTTTDSRYIRTPETNTIKGINVESKITSTTNPTILIINEYGEATEKNSRREGNDKNYSDLLLSIIEHETNKLNDEWDRVATKHVQERRNTNILGEEIKEFTKDLFNVTITPKGDRDYILKDAFVSIFKKGAAKKKTTTKSTMQPYTTSATTRQLDDASGDYDIVQSIRNLEIPETASDSPKGLFDKIASKLGVKVIRESKKKKAAKRVAAKMTSLKPHEQAEESTAKPGGTTKEPASDHNPTTMLSNTNAISSESVNEASESRPVSKICDLRATFNHIRKLYQHLRADDFENYARTVACYKFKRAPKYFLVKPANDGEKTTEPRKWDWIRDKRSLSDNYDEYFEGKHAILSEIGPRYDNVGFIDGSKIYDEIHDKKAILKRVNENIGKLAKFKVGDNNEDDSGRIRAKHLIEYDGFETFNRDKNGIYKTRKKRNKRTAVPKQAYGLKSLPRLKPSLDEIYVMLGDSVTVSCLAHRERSKHRSLDPTSYSWRTDRSDMLGQENVEINGPKVYIKMVQPKNVGRYYCNKNNKEKKNMRISVVTLPSFHVISTPLYTVDRQCIYDDLKSMNSLGPEISKVACCNRQCSVKVDEPLCLKDREDGKPLMKVAVVMTVNPHPELPCSVQCRRDLHTSVTLLHAINAKSVADVSVVLQGQKENKTLTPSKKIRVPIVTHTLRRKVSDANRRVNYHKLTSNLAPGDVTVLSLCPAGYYLIPEQKICATCPQDTCSSTGDNACAVCPRGMQAEPGAETCKLATSRMPRYDWWWYPPCGYCVACVVGVCACGACAVLALVVHLTARGAPAEGIDVRTSRTLLLSSETKRHPACTVCHARLHCRKHGRPLSPSRVILARFFRPSLSSARATDSQETKFEQWKERNIPPPLPPIDFDL